MFKIVTDKERLQIADSEIKKLRASVGELPQQEITEDSEVVQITIVNEIEQTKANLEYISIMTGVDL